MQTFLNPKRRPFESFEAYRVRRCAGNFHVADILKGRLFYGVTYRLVQDGKKTRAVGVSYVKEKK